MSVPPVTFARLRQWFDSQGVPVVHVPQKGDVDSLVCHPFDELAVLVAFSPSLSQIHLILSIGYPKLSDPAVVRRLLRALNKARSELITPTFCARLDDDQFWINVSDSVAGGLNDEQLDKMMQHLFAVLHVGWVDLEKYLPEVRS